ncbi:MAG: UTRA domain-containing protein [Agathobacter rectalis]
MPGLQRSDVETSIYSDIEKQLHRHIQGAHLSFQAVRPQALEKKYFHMNDNDFVCQVEELAYLDTSEIFEYSIARHLPQYFHFETNVIKNCMITEPMLNTRIQQENGGYNVF